MSLLKRVVRVAVLALSVCAGSVFAGTPSFTNVIVFGDSLSDIGNNSWVNEQGVVGAPITNLPAGAKAKLLWPNLLAAALHNAPISAADPIVSSSRSQQPLRPYSADIDYAWASAETGDNYVDDLSKQAYPPYVNCTKPGKVDTPNVHSCVPGMIKQVRQYLLDVNQNPSPRTLFILWAGGNDFFNDITKLLGHTQGNNALRAKEFTRLEATMNNQSPATGQVVYSNPVANIKIAVKMLIDAKVKPEQIYVFNLPDMSQTPAAKKLANGSQLILGVVSVLSKIYDSALKLDLCYSILHSKYNLPSSHVFAISGLMNRFVHDSSLDKQYHITNVADSCQANGAAPACVGYAFYNDKHPTRAVEQAIKDFFIKVL